MKTDDASSSIALFYVSIHTATKLFTPMKPTSTSSALFQHNKLATTRRRLNRLLCHSDCESVSAQENVLVSHECFKQLRMRSFIVIALLNKSLSSQALLALPQHPINTYAPFVLSQMRPVIDDSRVDGFDAAKLTAHAQDEHHKEEQDGPELRQWHQEDSLLSRLMDDQRRWWVDLQ